MGYIIQTLEDSLNSHAFQINGAIALKNYTAQVDGNKIKITSTQNAALSILECDVSEVEIDGVTYSNPVEAQNALQSIIYADLPIVILTASEKEKLIFKLPSTHTDAKKLLQADGSLFEIKDLQVGNNNAVTMSEATASYLHSANVFTGWVAGLGNIKGFNKIKFKIKGAVNTTFSVRVALFSGVFLEANKIVEKTVLNITTGDDGVGIVNVDLGLEVENTANEKIIFAYYASIKNQPLGKLVENNLPRALYATAAHTAGDSSTFVNGFRSATSNAFNFIPFIEFEGKNTIEGLPEQETSAVEILLPSHVYVAVGKETNIYFENVIDAPNSFYNYEIDMEGSVGKHMQRRWTFKPILSDVGTHKITIKIQNLSGEVLKSKEINIVVPSNNQVAQKCLSVGDSTTAPGKYIEIINSEQPNQITFLGNLGTSPNKHEGRGGWRWTDYAGNGRKLYKFTVTGVTTTPSIGATYKTTNGAIYKVAEINITSGAGYFKATKISGTYASGSGSATKQSGTGDATINYSALELTPANPFWSGTKIDFSAYMTANGYSMGAKDLIHFNLGINDIFHEATDASVSYVLGKIQEIINAIKVYSAVVNIGINLLIPSSNQDGFGGNYGSNQNAKQYMRNNKLLVKKLIDALDTEARRNANIYLIATNANFDSKFGMQHAELNANARTTEKETVWLNAVHPNGSGYYQMGDSLFGLLKHIQNK